MSKLTLDEAIQHCLEVAEENDLAAGTYELLAENNHNAYERLTAETNSSRCAKCAANHRQLADWLTELKEAKTIIRVCNRVLGYLLECEIENTSTRHEVETLLKNITEYLSGGSENDT